MRSVTVRKTKPPRLRRAAVLPVFSGLAALWLFLFFAAAPVSAAFPTEPFELPEGGLRFRFSGNAEDDSGAVAGRLRGNPRFVEGRDGTADGAVYFDTEEQSVALQLDDIEGNWTANFWVKASDVPHHVFLCSSVTGSLRLVQDNGTVGATMNGIIDRSVPYKVPSGTWTMLTFAYDDNLELTSVYVNGEFFDGMYGWQTLGLTLLGNDAPEQKGWQSAPHYALDDAWFFGRLLSDEEIRTLFETDEVPLPEPSAPEEAGQEEAAEAVPEQMSETDPVDNPANDQEETAEDKPEDFADPDPEDFPAAENGGGERKPGAFFAMGAILLCALFLVFQGGRALFGRSVR